MTLEHLSSWDVPRAPGIRHLARTHAGGKAKWGRLALTFTQGRQTSPDMDTDTDMGDSRG